MKTTIRLLSGFCLVCSLNSQTVRMGAQISGFVVSDSDAPPGLRGAHVVLIPEADLSASRQVLNALTTISGPNGEFSFSNVTPGTYKVCALVLKSELLDACGAGVAPPRLRVQPEQIFSRVAIHLRKGYLLPVHVDDPGGLLAKGKGSSPAGQVRIGVQRGNAPFAPARFVKEDAKGSDHTVLVAYDSPFDLYVTSRVFELEDERGGSLSNERAKMPGSVRRGEMDRKVTVRVKRAK